MARVRDAERDEPRIGTDEQMDLLAFAAWFYMRVRKRLDELQVRLVGDEHRWRGSVGDPFAQIAYLDVGHMQLGGRIDDLCLFDA